MGDFRELVRIANADDAIKWWHQFSAEKMIKMRDHYLSNKCKAMGELNVFDIKEIHDNYLKTWL